MSDGVSADRCGPELLEMDVAVLESGQPHDFGVTPAANRLKPTK